MPQDIKIEVDKNAFEIKKSSTKKAVYVLKDLFGDTDTSSNTSTLPKSRKKKSIALILGLFGAIIGIHRLYLGYISYFFLHLGAAFFAYFSYLLLPDSGLSLLVILCLILWAIADLLAILFGNIKDKKGHILENWW